MSKTEREAMEKAIVDGMSLRESATNRADRLRFATQIATIQIAVSLAKIADILREGEKR